VSVWPTVFLGLIALATLITAAIQVSVMIAAGRLIGRFTRLADKIERDLSPLVASLNSIGTDAAKAASVASAQVDRADRVFADVAERLDATMGTIQHAIATPARESAALMVGLRAAIESVRQSIANRPYRPRPGDDEDALFI
jgi:hypothetical protein